MFWWRHQQDIRVSNKQGPIFHLYIKYFAFLAQIRRKYVIFVIPTKNKVICGSESIYTKISADEACRFTDLFKYYVRHDDVITILYWKYDFRFEIRVSKLVYLVNFNS